MMSGVPGRVTMVEAGFLVRRDRCTLMQRYDGGTRFILAANGSSRLILHRRIWTAGGNHRPAKTEQEVAGKQCPYHQF